jgi:hypothetical protein
MGRASSIVRTVSAGSAGILLSGCIPIPLVSGYETGSRQNIPAQVPGFVVQGQTTRADVVLALGEPDRSADDGSWLLYGSGYSRGGLALVAVGGAGGALGIAEEKMRYRLLIFHFDTTGVLSSTELKEKYCPEWSVVAAPGPGSEPIRCFDLSGDKLAASDRAAVAAAGERVIGTYPHVIWWSDREQPPGVSVLLKPKEQGEWADLSITDGSLVLTPSLNPVPGPDFFYLVVPLQETVRLPLAIISEVSTRNRYFVTFVVLTLADGSRSSIQVMTPAGGSLYSWDNAQTKAAGAMLQESIQAAIGAAPVVPLPR